MNSGHALHHSTSRPLLAFARKNGSLFAIAVRRQFSYTIHLNSTRGCRAARRSRMPAERARLVFDNAENGHRCRTTVGGRPHAPCAVTSANKAQQLVANSMGCLFYQCNSRLRSRGAFTSRDKYTSVYISTPCATRKTRATLAHVTGVLHWRRYGGKLASGRAVCNNRTECGNGRFPWLAN
jgi:hypothetical protein